MKKDIIIKIFAFLAVYVIWGTTYLAIRISIETIPVFLMAGMRFVLAGSILYIFCLFKYKDRPSLKDWKNASVTGVLMLTVGNGCVVWSEQYIPSGLAALCISSSPIWFMLFDWGMNKRRVPSRATIVGIIIGLSGVMLLLNLNESIITASSMKKGSLMLSVLVLTIAAMFWSAGSVYMNRTKRKISMIYFAAIQMLSGGIAFLLIAGIQGEMTNFEFSSVSVRSIYAFIYLFILGSVIAYSAYSWLIKNVSPVKASTYAYVNPMIAVLVGYLFINEPVTSEMIIGGIFILFSVFLINFAKFRFSLVDRVFVWLGIVKTKKINCNNDIK